MASARFALTGAAPRARLREPSLLFSRDKRQGISYISFRGIWVLRVDNRVTVIHPEHAILSNPKLFGGGQKKLTKVDNLCFQGGYPIFQCVSEKIEKIFTLEKRWITFLFILKYCFIVFYKILYLKFKFVFLSLYQFYS